jgi:hypothetical protein
MGIAEFNLRHRPYALDLFDQTSQVVREDRSFGSRSDHHRHTIAWRQTGLDKSHCRILDHSQRAAAQM